MDIVTGILMYFVIWWIAIFAVLPFGLKRDENGIPQDPRIKHKILMISVVSAVVWAIVYVAVDSNIVSFRDMAKGM